MKGYVFGRMTQSLSHKPHLKGHSNNSTHYSVFAGLGVYYCVCVCVCENGSLKPFVSSE